MCSSDLKVVEREIDKKKLTKGVTKLSVLMKNKNRVETNEPHNDQKSQNDGSYDEENDIENTYEDSGEEAYESNEENKNDSDKNGKDNQETKFEVVFHRQENDYKGPRNQDNNQGS